MPMKPKSGCSWTGCPRLAEVGGRCAAHAREPWEGRRGFAGYNGDYPAMRRRVLAEEKTCAICGDAASCVDHINPVSRGGTHERKNLRALCKMCHDKRSRQQSRGK